MFINAWKIRNNTRKMIITVKVTLTKEYKAT